MYSYVCTDIGVLSATVHFVMLVSIPCIPGKT